MSRYEQRLADDKSDIRRRISAMGAIVGSAITTSVEALLAEDHSRSHRLVLEDLPVNRESRSIDKACHAFVARHLPSAGHLRFVSSVLRMNVALERVGDYAVSIARQGVRLKDSPDEATGAAMTDLAERSTTMLKDALAAFTTKDSELARETKAVAKAVGKDFDRIYTTLAEDSSRSVHDATGLLTVFNKLERVSDQAKNICEETLFELLGETKPPKRYRILFVDGRHSLIAPLAELLARKAFPESGHYASAGYRPADELAPELLSLVDDLGIDVGDLTPTKLDASSLSQYHVMVWLNGDPSAYIDELPYETVLLRWELPKFADAANISTQLREISNALSAEIRDLMVMMRGEDAN